MPIVLTEAHEVLFPTNVSEKTNPEYVIGTIPRDVGIPELILNDL
jgi:hypothetical protein